MAICVRCGANYIKRGPEMVCPLHSTDVKRVARYIYKLVKDRERQLEAGTWNGPVTEAQAKKYFGA